MNEIRIEDFNPSFAKSLADMWNRSADNWGGFDSNVTAESLIKQLELATNLHYYLALDNEEVVGCCSLSEYQEDEGSLYIPILNVRPDYHGKKIGKELVLNVVKRTVELGWPRLDLYTWPGNTKAVPLYKKCGFFWEKRDDTTHLMNFIPTVLQTEALQEYFTELDWYKDSTRDFDVEPDGVIENDFTYFEYSWRKNEKSIRAQFERSGRGLRLLETPDYLISMTVEDHNLVFGRNYRVVYKIINKSSEALNISFKGKDNKNIRFKFEKTVDVIDQATIEAEFFVDELAEEPSIWRTHPVVLTDIFINGAHALFKVGVVPKFPAKIMLHPMTNECYQGVDSELSIDIENSFSEIAIYRFTLQDTKNITFHQNDFEVTLKPNERKSIMTQYTLHKPCFYSEKIPVKITLANSETIEYFKSMNTPFSGRTGMFGGETEKMWLICNGSYRLELGKFKSVRKIKTYNISADDIPNIFCPKLGKPFTSEFSIKKPNQVEWYPDEDAMVLQATYKSKDFPGIELISFSRLFANGIVESYYQASNTFDQETQQEIYLNDSIYFDLYRGVIPYSDEIVEIQGSYGNDNDYWEGAKIRENWLFARGDKVPKGFCWPKNSKLINNNWFFSIEHSFGKLAGKEFKITEPIYFAIGTFNDWQSFRCFAQQKNQDEFMPVRNNLEMRINGGNPFVGNGFKVKVKDYKTTYFDGTLSLKSENNAFEPIKKSFISDDANSETEFTIKLDSDTIGDILHLDVDFAALQYEQKGLFFKPSTKTVKTEVVEDNGFKSLSIDNGIIKLKVAPEFGFVLYSLQYQNHEWLDSSFPNPRPRSWFNPWLGGIGIRPRLLSDNSLLEEAGSGEFIELTDNFGNCWSGIKLSMKIEKNKSYQGLEINQYYLVLPETPLVYYTTELVQNTGRFFDGEYFSSRAFIRSDEALHDSWLTTKDKTGNFTKYKGGKISLDILTHSPIMFGSNNKQEKLLVYVNEESNTMFGFINQIDLAAFGREKVYLKDQESRFISPMFFIFAEEYLDDDLLSPLKNITFNK